jgi:glycerophosphoryl diester phosphodiesterase
MIHAEKLIAHRGVMCQYPENTLPALGAAIRAGACQIEFDIQLSKDRIPMLFHDANLQRTTGLSGRISDYTARELFQIRADRLPHLTQDYADATIPTLSRAVGLLNAVTQINAFIEIKLYSISHFGVECCVNHVLNTLQSARFSWSLISSDSTALEFVRQQYDIPIGWILREHSKSSRKVASALSPSFIFCNINRLPRLTQPFWRGDWKWAVYDINDAQHAVRILEQGADFIETGCITKMLNAND